MVSAEYKKENIIHATASSKKCIKRQVCLVVIWRMFLFCCYIVRQRSKVSRILGETIRAKRIKAGLSQEKLAEKADLARNYIGNIERAEYKVTVEALARIAKALGIRLRDLVAKL